MLTICGAILCGGKSTRMGCDKSQLLWRGWTLLQSAQYQLSHLQQVLTVTSDLRPGCGPLGGIHTALCACSCDALFVTTCDQPLVDDAVIRQLVCALGDNDAAVAVDDVDMNPLLALYRKDCLKAVLRQLDAGDFSVRRVLSALAVARVPMAGEKLVNINTPQDYRTFLETQGDIPVCAFSGWANSGKTDFLEKLIPALARRGVRAAAVKHCHPALTAKTTNDIARFSAAGAAVALAAREELPSVSGIRNADLILAEGFNTGPWPRIWVHRDGAEPPCTHRPLLAMVSGTVFSSPVPRFDRQDANGVAEMLIKTFVARKAHGAAS